MFLLLLLLSLFLICVCVRRGKRKEEEVVCCVIHILLGREGGEETDGAKDGMGFALFYVEISFLTPSPTSIPQTLTLRRVCVCMWSIDLTQPTRRASVGSYPFSTLKAKKKKEREREMRIWEGASWCDPFLCVVHMTSEGRRDKQSPSLLLPSATLVLQ
jgi:hypothetical protein